MRKLAFIGLLGLVLLFVFGAEIQAQVPKEGSGSYTLGYSGTSKMISVGKDRIHMNYESLGVVIGDR